MNKLILILIFLLLPASAFAIDCHECNQCCQMYFDYNADGTEDADDALDFLEDHWLNPDADDFWNVCKQFRQYQNLPGDANFDQKVDLKDVVIILQILGGKNDE